MSFAFMFAKSIVTTDKKLPGEEEYYAMSAEERLSILDKFYQDLVQDCGTLAPRCQGNENG